MGFSLQCGILYMPQGAGRRWWRVLGWPCSGDPGWHAARRPAEALCLRWNYWMEFLVDVSVHKLESSYIRVFVWFSTFIFPFYKMQFMNTFKFSFFADFLFGFLKPEKRMFFFKICSRLWIAWSKRLESFVKMMSKNSVSGKNCLLVYPNHKFINDDILSFYAMYDTCDADGPDRIVEGQAGEVS